VTTDGYGTVKLWNTESGDLIHTFDFAETVAYMDFSSDTQLFACSGKSSLAVWDLTSGTRLFSEAPDGIGENGSVNQIAFSPNGRMMAFARTPGLIQLRDSRSGEVLGSLHGHRSASIMLAFSPSADQLATCGSGDLWLWNIGNLGVSANTRPPVSPRRVRPTTQSKIPRSFSSAHAISFTPNGKMIATGHSDGVVRFWNSVDLELSHSLGNPTPRSAPPPQPDFQELLKKYKNPAEAYREQSRIRNTRASWKPYVTTSAIGSLSFSTQGELLAVGKWNGQLDVWNLQSSSIVDSIEAHKHDITKVSIYESDSSIATSCSKGTRLWKLSDDKILPPMSQQITASPEESSAQTSVRVEGCLLRDWWTAESKFGIWQPGKSEKHL